MVELSNTVEISAAPERVWKALIDFANYGKWNPYVAIRGVATTGGEIEWSLGSTVLKRRIWTKAPLIEFREPHALAWSYGTQGIFSTEERFALEKTETGTQLHHSLRYRGLIAVLGGSYLRNNMEKIVTQADEGLRRYLGPKSGSPARSTRAPQLHARGKPARPKRKKR